MITYETNYLAHHGVKGMKWGVRRYQNKDGSLTPEGKKKYSSKLEKKRKNYINSIKSDLRYSQSAKKRLDEEYKDLKKEGTDSKTWTERTFDRTLGAAAVRERTGGEPLSLKDYHDYYNKRYSYGEMSEYMLRVKNDSKFKSKQIKASNDALAKLENYKIGELKTKKDYKKYKKKIREYYLSADKYYWD